MKKKPKKLKRGRPIEKLANAYVDLVKAQNPIMRALKAKAADDGGKK